MASKNYITIKDFQNYGKIFENIKTNDVLKEKIAEYGYGDTEIAQGKALYDEATLKMETNKNKTTSEKLAYDKFSKKFAELKTIYSEDRQKVKIIYKSDDRILSALGVKGTMTNKISDNLDSVDTLYKQLKTNEELRKPLERLKIDESYIATQISLLEEVQKLYAIYTNEKGESQQATKDKDTALATLEKWVREFFAIAKIALKDKPQLLESLGKLVKG